MMRPDFIPQDEWIYIIDYVADKFCQDYTVYRFEKGSGVSDELILEEKFISSFDWIFGLTLKVDALKKIIFSELRKDNFFRETPSKFSGLTYKITNQAKLYVEERKQDPNSCLYASPTNTYEIVRKGFFNIIEKYTDDLIPQNFELVSSVFGNSSLGEENERNSHVIEPRIENVPAADRTVSRLDNQKAWDDAVAGLDAAIEAVRGDNEYGARNPEDKEQRLTELTAGRKLFEAARISVHAIEAVVLKTLLYLAGIGVAVSQIVDAINKVKVLLGL